MRSVGVLLLFLVSLVALFFTLQVRRAGEVRVEPPSASKADRTARPMGLPSAEGRDAGWGQDGKLDPLRQLDPGKLERAYRLGVATRQQQ